MIKPMLAQDFHKDLSQRKIKKYEEEYEGHLDFKNLYSCLLYTSDAADE